MPLPIVYSLKLLEQYLAQSCLKRTFLLYCLSPSASQTRRTNAIAADLLSYYHYFFTTM